ncbi:MAG: hypothetical protein M3Y54_15140 [Bacteroidota bacterium]|nr:hypothetical protein [Bacteroidota bacterium]
MSFRSLPPLSLLLVCILALASCSHSNSEADANLIAANNYEAVIGWGGDTNSITREHAHSGHFAVKVDAAHEFGLGYGMKLGEATARKPHLLRISGWAYKTDDKSNARLGLQVFDMTAGKEVFGDGISYADLKDVKKWVHISKDIKLPETVNSTQQLRVFLWRGGATSPAYVDDLRIELVD